MAKAKSTIPKKVVKPVKDETKTQDDVKVEETKVVEKTEAELRAEARIEREAKEAAEAAEAAKANEVPIDEFGLEIFGTLGIEPSVKLRKTYNKFKKLKDTMQPGRLKPADFAVCVLLSELEG